MRKKNLYAVKLKYTMAAPAENKKSAMTFSSRVSISRHRLYAAPSCSTFSFRKLIAINLALVSRFVNLDYSSCLAKSLSFVNRV